MDTFGPPQRVLVRGEGAYVWDADGKRYLDLLGGIAVNALGHAHPTLTAAISAQLGTLGHVSNFFGTPDADRARRAAARACAGAPEGSRVFFTNSGTEANEAAFKLARRTGRPAAILALEGAFHGRTMGALALTAKAAYREPFEPLPGGVEFLPFGDADALEAAFAVDGDDVAALVVEPIQGEAGVRPLPPGYLARGPRAHRRRTARCSCSTRCRPAWAGPAPGSRTSTRTSAAASCPTSSRSPRASAAASRSAPSSPTASGPRRCSAAASTARRSAATRSRPRPPLATHRRHRARRAAGARRARSVRRCATGSPPRAPARRPRSAARACSSRVELTRARGRRGRRPGARRRGSSSTRCTPTAIRLAPPLILTADQADDFVAFLAAVRRTS